MFFVVLSSTLSTTMISSAMCCGLDAGLDPALRIFDCYKKGNAVFAVSGFFINPVLESTA